MLPGVIIGENAVIGGGGYRYKRYCSQYNLLLQNYFKTIIFYKDYANE
ncbi:hypothetical protein OLU51_01770 [Campylobacter jejuni]|nr:hypothetical protein [Campylobacter jejuni]